MLAPLPFPTLSAIIWFLIERGYEDALLRDQRGRTETVGNWLRRTGEPRSFGLWHLTVGTDGLAIVGPNSEIIRQA